jgi:ribosomal protein L37AE/L43A
MLTFSITKTTEKDMLKEFYQADFPCPNCSVLNKRFVRKGVWKKDVLVICDSCGVGFTGMTEGTYER